MVGGGGLGSERPGPPGEGEDEEPYAVATGDELEFAVFVVALACEEPVVPGGGVFGEGAQARDALEVTPVGHPFLDCARAVLGGETVTLGCRWEWEWGVGECIE